MPSVKINSESSSSGFRDSSVTDIHREKEGGEINRKNDRRHRGPRCKPEIQKQRQKERKGGEEPETESETKKSAARQRETENERQRGIRGKR